MPFPRCWRLFQKIPASSQIFYALSPRNPDCVHWPLMRQDLLMDPLTLYKAISLHPDPRIKILSGWVKVTKVTEIWECCSFKLWMKRGTRRKLPSLDAAVSPRQGDDRYIVDHRYYISIPFPRCWRFFQKIPAYVQIFHALSPRDPDCLHWPLICQKWKNAGHILAVQLHMTDISSGWVNGDHCVLEALLNGPCKVCEGIYLTVSRMASVHLRLLCKARAFSWQESQHHKYCTILHPFRKQEPYRYSVSLEGCSGGVGAHCTTPAGDDQHSWRSVATPYTWKWTHRQQHVLLPEEWKNATGSETWVYKSCSYLVFSICNAALKQHRIVGLWTCLAQISTAPKSEY